MITLKDFIKQKKFSFIPSFDERINRFDRNGKIGSGWALGKVFQYKGSPVKCVIFGDFATSEKHTWISKEFSPDERKELEEIIEKEQEAFKERKAAEQVQAAARVEDLFSKADVLSNTLPHYATRKGLGGLYGAKAMGTSVVVPLYDVEGKLWNVQRIEPDGTKRFYPRAKVLGNFFTIGNLEKAEVIYVCEGYATGVTIFECLTGMASLGSEKPPRSKENGGMDEPRNTPSALTRNRNEQKEPRAVGHQLVGPKTKRAHKGATSENGYTASLRNDHDRGPSENASNLSKPEEKRSKLGSNTRQEANESDSANQCAAPGRRDNFDGSASETFEAWIYEPRFSKGKLRAAVVCSFNTANLTSVCSAIRKAFKKTPMVVCIDEDLATKDAEGKPLNPGREAGFKAAKACGGFICAPLFKDRGSAIDHRYSDFNDLALVEKPATARSQILKATLQALGHTPEDDMQTEQVKPDVKQIPKNLRAIVNFANNGKEVAPTDLQILETLLPLHQDNMCKQREKLFRFVGTHWKQLNEVDLQQIELQIQLLLGSFVTANRIDQIFELFVKQIESVPETISLFTSSPLACNFLNGTMHIIPNNGEYTLKFREHNKLDYLINVLDFNYTEDLPDNEEFLDMIERVFEGDNDKEEKIRATRQMFGACLVPLFPHLFMLYGRPGTGKSTVMKIAARLVNENNLCRVEPKDFKGFGMSSMPGKLVNIDTDISIRQPIMDSIVKKIEDREKFRIESKYSQDVYAPLPAIHIFGGNDIPPTMEGASKAHDRRWTFLCFDKVMAIGNYNKMYAENCFDHCPEGILKFALQGLFDLIESRGHFTQPTSGKEKMQEWQLENDLIGMFIEQIKAGEIGDGNNRLMIKKEGRISRITLYKAFVDFTREMAGSFKKTVSQKQFNKEMRAHGFGEVKNNTWFFVGLTLEIDSRAEY